MSEIINFTKQRKAKARSAKDAQAAENRVKFGQTRQEKLLAKAKAEKLAKHLEGHKRETDGE